MVKEREEETEKKERKDSEGGGSGRDAYQTMIKAYCLYIKRTIHIKKL